MNNINFNELNFINKYTLNYYKILIFSSFLAGANIYIPFIPNRIFGFSLTGYAWILVLIVSILYLFELFAKKSKTSKFPLVIWLPWICLSLIYFFLNINSITLHATAQSFVPILVGLVAGSLEYNEKTLQKILTYFKYLIILIIISNIFLSYIRFGILGYGSATDSHLTAIATIITFAFYYKHKKSKYLIYYALMLLVQIVAVTRIGIVALLIIPLIHFYQTLNYKKILMILVLIPVSLSIFQLPNIQKKMFYTGRGSIKDISYFSENLNTSGRKFVNEILINEFRKDPFWGKGTRADYFILKKYGLDINETHNDYLQLLVNFGFFGTFVLLFTFIIQFTLLIKLKIYTEQEKILRSIILTMQVVLFLFMATNTIYRGTYDFMNYYFGLIGMIYAINFHRRKTGGKI